MNVPTHMEITASLLAGYRMQDGSLIEVDASGDYRITNAEGQIICDTVDERDDCGMRRGIGWNDYGEILDDLAAFLCADADMAESQQVEPDHDVEEYIFSGTVARWANDHYDELSTLANYREDKRLGEGQFAEEE